MRRLDLATALAAAAAALLVGPAAAGNRAWGRIVIPRIGLDTLFYNGQSEAATDFGPAHYPWTAMPGQGRTVGIAGHRVTHTHPFERLAELRRGDFIVVRYGAAPRFPRRACYRVRRFAVVSPDDVAVLRNVGVDRLVLTTCTPPHFATYRLVVFAPRTTSCGA